MGTRRIFVCAIFPYPPPSQVLDWGNREEGAAGPSGVFHAASMAWRQGEVDKLEPAQPCIVSSPLPWRHFATEGSAGRCSSSRSRARPRLCERVTRQPKVNV